MTAPDAPKWVPDAVFYEIFPDRFARSLTVPKPAGLESWGSPPTRDGYQGGDLIGVAERLDYLADLGINALYLTPIFQSASNHRYHTHDYEKVDPMLGGTPALRRLLDDAHARGMRVMLDGVFNHASRGFFPFHDILENGSSSAYLDWFHIRQFPLSPYDGGRPAGYDAWWGLRALPKFNTDTPAVREYLWGIARRWIDFGIDGWRLDVPNEIDDDDFWREFRRRVRVGNSETYLVGELWDEATRWLRGDIFDGVMNYQFTQACLGFFIGEEIDRDCVTKTCLQPGMVKGAEGFARAIERLQSLHPPAVTQVMLNLLGSHDMARFLTLAHGDRSALELATLFQMTYPGAPCVYYGDEIGMTGGHDPANRGAFPWEDETAWDRELLHLFQRLIALRHESEALRRGSYRCIYGREDVHAHVREDERETVVVALNAGRGTRRVDLTLALGEGAVLREVWGHEEVRVESGLIRRLELPPRSGRVFRLAPDQ